MTLAVLLVITVFLALGFVLRARDCSGKVPLENPAVMLMAAFVAYGVLPPFLWFIQGGEYQTPLSGRLYLWQPSYTEQLKLMALGFIFLLSFLFGSWRFVKGGRIGNEAAGVQVPRQIMWSALLFVIAAGAVREALILAGVMREATSYEDSYAVVQQLPLVLRQFLRIISGVAEFAEVVVLVFLFQHWRTHKIWIYLFLCYSLISFDSSGGRSQLMFSLLTCLILWNYYVSGFRLRTLTLLFVIGLLVFIALGLLRGFLIDGGSNAAFSVFAPRLGEFEALWGNAIELGREKNQGLSIPANVVLTELFAFMPSNILPFEKISYSVWYMETFYPDAKDAGGGNMFGLHSQLVVGSGVVEGVFRGLVLGLLIGWVSARLVSLRRWWSLPTLVYFSIWIFYTLRDSAFSILNNFQLAFLSILAISALSALMRSRQYAAAAG